MKKIIIYLLFTICIFSENYKVIVQEDVFEDYQKFLNGRSPLEISDYGGEYSRRDVVELVIMKQALKLGGFDGQIDFFFSPTDKRNIATVRDGVAIARGTSFWKEEIEKEEDKFYNSYPLIKKGNFVAGFYYSKDNPNIHDELSLEQLKKLSIVSSKDWAVDWETLLSFGFYNVYDVDNWESMVNMIKFGRMDLLLAPFQNTEDLSLTVEGIRFYPVKNIKIELIGTRTFVVSKEHPKGKEFLEALNRGLMEMDRIGLLDKIYTQSGFYNEKVKDWKFVTKERKDGF